MTCEDYLSMLETLPVQELAYGEARDHAAFCADCNRVTRVVAARERNMTLAYESAYPSASATTVAERAIAAARRQRIAFFLRAGLAAAAVLVVALFIVTRRIVPANGIASMQQFNLRCLSPDQASTLIRQQVPDGERITIRVPPRVAVVEVGGSTEQVRIASALIDRFDNDQEARCATPVVPTVRETRAVPAVRAVPARPTVAPR